MAVANPPRPAVLVYPALPPLPAGEWPAQGDWTYEEYLRLPDVPGRTYEVLFGVLYMANTPDIAHQNAVTEIGTRLRTFVRDQRLGTVLVAPVEVRLPGAADPVQPDVLFVRAERHEIIGNQYISGAPDLVIEVLSPGTWQVDRRAKYDAYELAGVAEYWMVNTKARTVEVYRLKGQVYEFVGEYGEGE